ncbi:hypothetical protein V5799_014215 [Amblyomma americanum]|uniref:Uncharacterized protein n=1 Tax=Amblyomma americanum TaxID=6943 RepID=A0AAQ4E3X8_AMBAM
MAAYTRDWNPTARENTGKSHTTTLTWNLRAFEFVSSFSCHLAASNQHLCGRLRIRSVLLGPNHVFAEYPAVSLKKDCSCVSATHEEGQYFLLFKEVPETVATKLTQVVLDANATVLPYTFQQSRYVYQQLTVCQEAQKRSDYGASYGGGSAYTSSSYLVKTIKYYYPAPSYAPSYSAPAPSYSAPSYSAPSYSAPAPSYSAATYAPPSYSAPSYAPPSYSAPSYAPPAYSAPSYSAPSYSAPTYAPPSYSAPSYAPPSYSAPSYAPPSYSAPSYAPPSYSAPAYSAPASYGGSDDSYGGYGLTYFPAHGYGGARYQIKRQDDSSYISSASSYPASSVTYTYVTYMPPAYSAAGSSYAGKNKKASRYGGYATPIRYDPTYEPNPGYKAPGWYMPYIKYHASRKPRDVKPFDMNDYEFVPHAGGLTRNPHNIYMPIYRSIVRRKRPVFLSGYGYFDPTKKMSFGLAGRPYFTGAEKALFRGYGGYGSLDVSYADNKDHVHGLHGDEY